MFKSLFQKVASMVHKVPTVVKPTEKVPFDLVVGSHLKFDTNIPFIYKSLCTLPAFNSVTSIGKFVLGDSKIYRFYFNDGHFLQTITGLNDLLEECRLFTLIDTHMPSTVAGWSKYLEKEVGLIGLMDFALEGTDINYTRMSSWADDEPDWCPPVSFLESVHTSNDNLGTYVKYHQAMSYGRWLNEQNKIAEYLLISAESKENMESITTYIGLDINPVEVKSYF